MEIVKPGGTGKPILPISDKFAPFPPKIFFEKFILLEIKESAQLEVWEGTTQWKKEIFLYE